jgi:hypothetical protein
MYEIRPLKERKADWIPLAFFLINLPFITYIVDIEQIIISDPYNFEYPWWPPPFFVDMVHWWGKNFDPVLMARPVWWKVTIWWDSLFFGPFYAFAIYAYIKGREWIRIPSIIWASVMISGVLVIVSEEIWGAHATPRPGIVLLANAPWLIIPLFVLFRMSLKERPFSKRADKV